MWKMTYLIFNLILLFYFVYLSLLLFLFTGTQKKFTNIKYIKQSDFLEPLFLFCLFEHQNERTVVFLGGGGVFCLVGLLFYCVFIYFLFSFTFVSFFVFICFCFSSLIVFWTNKVPTFSKQSDFIL